jgi:hypothetical protein
MGMKRALKIFVEKDLTKKNIKIFVLSIVIILYIILAIPVAGSIFRQVYSPYIWEYPTQPDLLSRIIIIISYLSFYFLGYLIPYYFIKSTIYLIYFKDIIHVPFEVVIPIGCIALACLITFVVYLQPIIEFFNYLPTDIWNGWLMVLWFFIVLFFGGGGILSLHEQIVKYSKKISEE